MAALRPERPHHIQIRERVRKRETRAEKRASQLEFGEDTPRQHLVLPAIPACPAELYAIQGQPLHLPHCQKKLTQDPGQN